MLLLHGVANTSKIDSFLVMLLQGNCYLMRCEYNMEVKNLVYLHTERKQIDSILEDKAVSNIPSDLF